MADITHSRICTSYDAGVCRLTGQPCPFATNPGDCPDSTFLARVSMPPDEFTVLLNAARQPALGTLSFKKCRVLEYHHAVPGVHVNAILEFPSDLALLQVTWHADGSVEYFCPATDVRFLWREGHFIPM